MYRFFLLAVLLCPVALADSVSFAGSCLTNPCTEQIVDQYGDAWAYLQYNIGPSGGSAYSSLALTGAYTYYHPDAQPVVPAGAEGQAPSVYFQTTWDLPTVVDGTLNVFFESFGQSDECEGCAPFVSVSGLPNDGVRICCTDIVEYANVAPGTIVTFTGSVSTEIQDSFDELYWGASYEIDPAPEPASWLLGALGLVLVWRLYSRKSLQTDRRL
jgi:hypothetical protein